MINWYRYEVADFLGHTLTATHVEEKLKVTFLFPVGDNQAELHVFPPENRISISLSSGEKLAVWEQECIRIDLDERGDGSGEKCIQITSGLALGQICASIVISRHNGTYHITQSAKRALNPEF